MRFNTRKSAETLTNYEGAKAFALQPDAELYAAVATTLLNDAFYEGKEDRLQRVKMLIAQNEPEFVAKLAVYARENMRLRSIPLVLAGELSRAHSGDNLVRRTVRRVIQRADEITELLAYYQASGAREGPKKLNRLSKQLQKGLADAFHKFDAYQFAKYNRKTEVRLRDALFLAHPKPQNAAQEALFKQIANDTLPPAETWERKLSAAGQNAGQTPEEKAVAAREEWVWLIENGKLGYMAALRNLRNMMKAGVPETMLAKVAARIGDPASVRKSKQLPFRFLAAYREIKQAEHPFAGAFLEALEAAMIASADNIPGFGPETRVVIASDVSGSMGMPISPKSAIRNIDVGLVLSLLLNARCQNVTAGVFGADWMTVNLPKRAILQSAEQMRELGSKVGYATNGYKVLRYLIDKKIAADKVMIFTDCQMWNSEGDGATFRGLWLKYLSRIAPKARLYLFDLAGYGQAPLEVFSKYNVCMIAGWSDKVFEVLESIENNETAMQQIRAVQL